MQTILEVGQGLGGQIIQTSSSTAATVIYQFTLAAGQTLGPSADRMFAAQTSGSGTAHPTSDDTYTTCSQSVTQSRSF